MKALIIIVVLFYSFIVVRGLRNKKVKKGSIDSEKKGSIDTEKPTYYLHGAPCYEEVNLRTRQRLERLNSLGLRDLTGMGDFGVRQNSHCIYIEDVWAKSNEDFDRLVNTFFPIELI